LTMNFMLPVPEASVPAVEICCDRSAAGITGVGEGGGQLQALPYHTPSSSPGDSLSLW
jgi:hypothetical protein